MSDDSVYSDNGEYLGEMVIAEDGARVLVNEGEVIAAVDESGDPLDPAAYELQDPDDEGGYDETDDLRDQIDELREWTENYDPIAMREEARAAGAAVSNGLAEQQWADAMNRELDNVQNALGRQLTQREMNGILSDAADDRDAGLATNMAKHIEAAGLIEFVPGHGEGHGHADARRAFMAGLVADGEREERGEIYGDRPAWIEPASSDPGDIRRANVANAANGHEVDFSNSNEEDY